MTHHQDQFGAGGRAGELQAAEDVVVGDVAGDARIEGVADAGIENDFRRRARVDAAEDRRSRQMICLNASTIGVTT